MKEAFKDIKAQMKALREEEDGATMIEYSVLIALITIVIITLITTVGTQIEAAWQSLTNALAGGGGGG